MPIDSHLVAWTGQSERVTVRGPFNFIRVRDGAELACLLTNAWSPSDGWPVHIGRASRPGLWCWAFLLPIYHNLHLSDYLKLLSPFPPCFPPLFPSFFFCPPFSLYPLFSLSLSSFFSTFFSSTMCSSRKRSWKDQVQLQKWQHSLGLEKMGETKLKSSET